MTNGWGTRTNPGVAKILDLQVHSVSFLRRSKLLCSSIGKYQLSWNFHNHWIEDEKLCKNFIDSYISMWFVQLASSMKEKLFLTPMLEHSNFDLLCKLTEWTWRSKILATPGFVLVPYPLVIIELCFLHINFTVHWVFKGPRSHWRFGDPKVFSKTLRSMYLLKYSSHSDGKYVNRLQISRGIWKSHWSNRSNLLITLIR
jgi:hypothetical protein